MGPVSGRSWLRPLAGLASAILLLGASCSSSPAGTDALPTGDAYVCRQPPTATECDPPPNKASVDKYYCWGCNCAGPNPVAACNPMTNDCRYFADGCIPKSYSLCDRSAKDLVLALCGHCFFQEAGYPADCDKLKGGTGGAKDLGGLH